MYRLNLVCEGPTDYHVIHAALMAHFPEPFILTQLQPDASRYGGDAGPHGGGWKGVRDWCQSVAAAGGLHAVRALAPDVHALIIHIDADIAADAEIVLAQPCPPPLLTTQALERVILDWLGLTARPERLIFCIPAQATEAWMVRGLQPARPEAARCAEHADGAPCVECLDAPARLLLSHRPKLLRQRGAELKKIATSYRDHGARLTQAWPDIIAHCHTAQRFAEQLSALPALTR